MGKKPAVKLEAPSRVTYLRSCASLVKRTREFSEADKDDQPPKRMKKLIQSQLEYLPGPEVELIEYKFTPLELKPPPTRQGHTQALAMSTFQVRLAIFKHLPVSSLLQFSLVCKDWYNETRSVIEKSKTSTAFIPGHQPCIDLLNLNNEIPWMKRLPFNSLNIKDFRDHQPCFGSHEKIDMNKFLGNILALPLKALEINRNRWMGSNCLASVLLREAFRGRFPTIETMILPLLPPMGVYPGEEDIFKENSLPNLKYLEYRMDKSSSKPLFLLAIRSAPNLQEILTPFEVSSFTNELESMTSTQLTLVKWLLLQPVTSVQHSIVRMINCSSGLRRLEVMEPVMTSDRSWIMTLNILLECSRSTLEHLSLANHQLMLSLIRTIVKPFPSLKYFQISIASMIDELPAILSRFHLRQLFPNLIGLRIFFNQLSMNQAADLDTTKDTFQDFHNGGENSELWPPLTRLELHVSPGSFSNGIFDHFALKCPQITEFVYKGLEEKFLNYHMLTCFPHLKRLKLIVTANHVANLDEFLCGLYAEEVKELRELTVDRLKQSHVVARRHCMHNLNDLKHFNLVIYGAEKLKDDQSRQKSILSHVTGVLIFSRWPSLKVEINCHLDHVRFMRYEELNHLSPFAKVNYISRY